jgi:hypothetical protein
MKLKKIFMTALAILPVIAFAQGIQTKKVSFPAGKTGTTINGTIKGSQTIDYTVDAGKGQELSVSLASKSTSIYFNVLAPDSTGEAMYIGETDGTNSFKGILPSKGVYKIRVFLVRSAARKNGTANFTLKIGAK